MTRSDTPLSTPYVPHVLIVFLVTAVLTVSVQTGLAMSAHDFTFRTIDGKDLPMQGFRDQPVLLVNTASYCGFTPQYKDLQSLWETYRERGLMVVGVPSNDFGQQEPDSAPQIKQFCEVNFGVDFPLTTKQHVIGKEAHPLYQWIAAALGKERIPTWNFYKYLIAPDGSLAGAWSSHVQPLSPEITQAIETLLSSRE